MTTTIDALASDIETCHQLIRELLESLTAQTHLSEKLQHQLAQLLRQRYGRKTEKSIREAVTDQSPRMITKS